MTTIYISDAKSIVMNDASFQNCSLLNRGGVITLINTVFSGQRLIFLNSYAIKGGVISSVNSLLTILDSLFANN